MKKLILLLLILSPVCLKAQTVVSPPKTSVFLLDSVVISRDQLKEIKPNDIVEVVVMSEEDSQLKYQVERATLFTTWKAAVKQYKDIFSSVSADYKKYLQANNNDDTNITYFINGVKLDGQTNRTIPLRKASKLIQILSFKVDGLTADDKRATATIVTAK